MDGSAQAMWPKNFRQVVWINVCKWWLDSALADLHYCTGGPLREKCVPFKKFIEYNADTIGQIPPDSSPAVKWVTMFWLHGKCGKDEDSIRVITRWGERCDLGNTVA